MDVSHLYNDSFFGSTSTVLDVKEKMRTKEINAREDRSFERWTHIFQRGKEMCEKNTTWEKFKIYEGLRSIWERTPRLEKSLATENARVESLQRSLLARINPQNPDKTVTQDIHHNQSLQVHRVTDTGVQGDRKRARHRGTDCNRSRKMDKALPSDLALHSRHHVPAGFVRSSEHVIRSLVRLHRHRERRRQEHTKLKDELVKLSKPVIYKARVILRGYPYFDSDLYLNELESYLRYGNGKPEDQSNHPQETEVSSPIFESANVQQLGEFKESATLLPPIFEHSNKDVPADFILSTEAVDNNNNNIYVANKDKDVDGNLINHNSDVLNLENMAELERTKKATPLILKQRKMYTPGDVRCGNKHVPLPRIGVTKSVPRLNPADAANIILLGGTNRDNTSGVCKKNGLSVSSRKRLPSIVSQDGGFNSRCNTRKRKDPGTSNSSSSSLRNIHTSNTSSKIDISSSSNKSTESSNHGSIFIDNKDENVNNCKSDSSTPDKSTNKTAGYNNSRSSIVFKSSNSRDASKNVKITAFKNSRASNVQNGYVNKAQSDSFVNNALVNSDSNSINNTYINSASEYIDTNSALKDKDTNSVLRNSNTRNAFNDNDTNKAPNNSTLNTAVNDSDTTINTAVNDSDTNIELWNTQFNNPPTDITRNHSSIEKISNLTFSERKNNKFVFTPSASVSQVILEENEV